MKLHSKAKEIESKSNVCSNTALKPTKTSLALKEINTEINSYILNRPRARSDCYKPLGKPQNISYKGYYKYPKRMKNTFCESHLNSVTPLFRGSMQVNPDEGLGRNFN